MKTKLYAILAVAPFVFWVSSLSAHEGETATSVGLEKLGKVHFQTSCSAAVAQQFDRAVALLHSFWFQESGKAFAAIAQADPGCTMAHWGSAMTLFGNPFTWPLTGKALTEGWAEVEKAKAAQAKTPRERDYIAAVEAFYKDSDTRDHRSRALAYGKAMEKVYHRYPKDTEAAVFCALALNTTALPTDKTYAQQLKAGVILEKVFKTQPNHPGVAHYLIHSYDYPPTAKLGMPAARLYASIAPAAPHALHMPSHIFTRLGSWQDSIATNLASKNSTSDHFDQLHAMDYLMYAYLQTGQYQQAQQIRDEVLALKKVNSERFPAAYALAAIPARFALERNRWADAANLTVHPDEMDYPWASFPQAEAVTTFARALGSARSGDLVAARKEVEKLESLKNSMVKQNIPYWATQTDIQIRIATAWIARAEGKKEEALALMRAAADLEATTEKHPVTPGSLVSTRELLGEMLLDLHQPARALEEFESARRVEPNRFKGWYGAAQAAELAGDKAKAQTYYTHFVTLCEKADGDQPELKHAQEYLAKK